MMTDKGIKERPTYKKINALDHIEPKINKKSATKKLLKSSKIGLA